MELWNSPIFNATITTIARRSYNQNYVSRIVDVITSSPTQVLSDYGFLWDSSVSIPPLEVPYWPYTLDYLISHECKAGSCPTHSFPG